MTDVGLRELAALKNLTTLDLTTIYLTDPKVTDAGVKVLQNLLPKCKISRGYRGGR